MFIILSEVQRSRRILIIDSSINKNEEPCRDSSFLEWQNVSFTTLYLDCFVPRNDKEYKTLKKLETLNLKQSLPYNIQLSEPQQ